MTNKEKLIYIHETFIQDDEEACLGLIKEYGLATFWEDYMQHLRNRGLSEKELTSFYVILSLAYWDSLK